MLERPAACHLAPEAAAGWVTIMLMYREHNTLQGVAEHAGTYKCQWVPTSSR